ncbi:endonuclease domain-containing protein [Microbacterium sp.]|uniref:endonuclease domain-containing protein n=1 Tax=Microbacterium sp. TaxID=51671 RepID=UPI0039E4562E
MPRPDFRRDTAVAAAVRAVAARDGVASTTRLRRDGHSRHYLAHAVERGALVRVRRDWVALPGADAELVSAATHGVALTCVSQARRQGLFVMSEDRCHVAADPGARGGKPARFVVHWSKPIVPREVGALVDPIENVLALVATCQPHDAALVVWESALRKGLVDAQSLARLPLPASARALLAEATPFSDSGLETLFAARLRWLDVRIVPQAWIDGHRVDFLLGERLVVQIDGGHHVGSQRTSDIAHDARLMLMGYHVLRFSYTQIMNDWPAVQDAIARAVAQGLHRAR